MAEKKLAMASTDPYNPLAKEKLGESVANALLKMPLLDFPPAPFQGAGVYALYYSGSFSHYAPIRVDDAKGVDGCPIYVGKAVPKGARKGHRILDSAGGDSLYRRLKEHAESIEQVGLGVSNFKCRYLVVDDIWIPLGESLLIKKFNPLWNVLLDGFGNHDPGRKREKSENSRWDTVHPGRLWVEKRSLVPNKKTKHEWLQEIDRFLSTGESADLVMEEGIDYIAGDQDE